MTLVTVANLDPKRFFKSGSATPQGTSFDLTIGHIIDRKGKEVEGPFTIKPGQMVQVVSAEIFELSDRTTGHVTYKTTLTKKGIWALTVGIVDPGWDGPIATTLLNFSRIDHSITKGDAFLRVSFFEHDPVPQDKLRSAPPLDAYLKEIQKAAASEFPLTFLDTEKIADAAGTKVMDRIRTQALSWVVGIGLLFAIVNGVTTWIGRAAQPANTSGEELGALKKELLSIQEDLKEQKKIMKLLTHTSDEHASPQTAPAPLNKTK